MDYFDEVLAVLRRWEGLGTMQGKGVFRIGHIPDRAPLAYLNAVYDPLTPKQIDQMARELGHRPPPPLEAFYLRANGMHLFRTLSINGQLLAGVAQPISNRYQNIIEIPKGKTADMFFFGGYNNPPCHLYMRDAEPTVYLCGRDTALPVLSQWPDFPTFLVSEVNRLAGLFDEQGRKRDPSAPTAPVA